MNVPLQIKLLLQLNRLETNGNGVDKTDAFRKLERRLDPSLLKLFRKLRERKGTGTAILKDGMCSACMLVYPKTHEILHYKNTIRFCEFCGRLLVVHEEAA